MVRVMDRVVVVVVVVAVVVSCVQGGRVVLGVAGLNV